jgi:hypothetical protein
MAVCATFPEWARPTSLDETVWINTSPAVWWFNGGESSNFRIEGSNIRSREFRASVDTPYVYIAPGETLSYPGAAPAMSWHIDQRLTETWLAMDIYKSTIKSAVGGLLSKALKAKANKAVKSCTLAYLGAAETGAEFGESEAVDNFFGTVAAAGGATMCAKDWAAADNAIKQFPSYTDDVVEAGELSANVMKVKKVAGWVSTGCIIVRFVPRC